MKKLILFSLVFGSCAYALVPNFFGRPSRLRDCNTRGWVTLRLPSPESLTFDRHSNGCVAHFKIDSRTPLISDGARAEIEDPLRVPVGTHLTYTFSTFLPETMRGNNKPNLVLAQWHDNKSPGEDVQRPPLSIRLRGDRFVIPLFNDEIIRAQGLHGPGFPLYSGPAVYGQWVKWLVKVNWAKDQNGRVEIYQNGIRVANYRGYAGYPADPTAPYFKIGIYTTQKVNRPLEVFHTDYRRTYGAR